MSRGCWTCRDMEFSFYHVLFETISREKNYIVEFPKESKDRLALSFGEVI